MTNVHQQKNMQMSYEDFPMMGAMAPVQTKTLPKRKRNSKGCKIPLAQLGFVSRMDTLKSNLYSNYKTHSRKGRGWRGPDIDKRTAAFEQLKDKDTMSKRLNKTRLCWSVQKGVPCPHGIGKCTFAHTKEELRMEPCLFGYHCRFVSWREEEYCNNSSCKRKCTYLHPEETRDNYMKRTGLDKIEIKIIAPIKTKVTDLVPVQVKDRMKRWTAPSIKINLETEVKTEVKTEVNKMTFTENLVVDEEDEVEDEEEDEDEDEVEDEEEEDEVEDEDEDEDEEDEDDEEEELLDDYVSYTIPKEIAIETLKAAIEAGQKNINLTIV